MRGITFCFRDGGNRIAVRYSQWTGMERVFVNDVLVVNRRNISVKSTNSFEFGGDEFTVDFQAESLLKGPVRCTLSKAGRAVQRQTLDFEDGAAGEVSFELPLWLNVVLLAIAGVAYGVLFNVFEISHWLLFFGIFTAYFICRLGVAVFRVCRECRFVIKTEDLS